MQHLMVEDKYTDLHNQMTQQVIKLRAWQTAQVPGSEYATLYQNRITALTAAVLTLEERIPRLRELDRLIRQARVTKENAELAAGGVGPIFVRGALVLVGLAIALGSLIEGWAWPVLVFGIVLALGAGLATWMKILSHQDDLDDLDDAEDNLDALIVEREKLLPPSEIRTTEELTVRPPTGATLFGQAPKELERVERA